MKTPDLLDHPKLRKFVRNIPAGEFLFKQGQSGSTMFIILKGMVELVAERDGLSHVTELIEHGGFLGERAIVTTDPYRRYYSARANQDCVVLEMSGKDLEFLKIAVPELMTEIMTKAFEVAAKRLQRMNFLVNALRPSNNEERFFSCVLYFCRTTGTAVPNGLEVPLSVEGVCHYTDIPPQDARRRFGELEKERLIEKLPNGFYLVPSVQAIADRVPSSLHSH